jgi:WD40 repeat protein
VQPVYALEVSPDGRFAVFGRGNRLRLIELQHPDQAVALIDPALEPPGIAGVDLVQSLAFSPDGTRVAAGGFRTVRIWRREFEQVAAGSTPLGLARGVAQISRDETTAAFVNAVGDVEVWDVAAHQQRHVLTTSGAAVVALGLTAEAGRLALFDEAGGIQLWELGRGEKLCELTLPYSLRRGALSADGQFLAAVTHQGQVLLLRQQPATEAESAALQMVKESLLEIQDARDIAFVAHPEAALAIATGSGGVPLVAIESLQTLQTIEPPTPVQSMAVAAEQNLLALGLIDGGVALWDLAAGALKITLRGTSQSRLRLRRQEQVSAAQQAVLAKLNGRTAGLEALLKKENEALTQATDARDQALTALQEKQQAQATAEQQLAASTEAIAQAKQTVSAGEKKIAMLETTLGEKQTRAEQLAAEIAEKEKMLAELRAEAEAAQRQLATQQTAVNEATEVILTKEKEIGPQRAAIAKAKEQVEASQAEVAKKEQALAAATSAQQLAARVVPEHKATIAAEDRRAARIDAALKASRAQHEMAPPVAAVTFDRSGSRLAALLEDGQMRVYRLTDGLPLADFDFDAREVRCGLVWHGETIASWSADALAELRSLESSWRLERKIGGLQQSPLSDRVTSLAFDRTGMVLAAGSGQPSRSGQVELFAVDTGRILRSFPDAHSDIVLGLGFSPDNRLLASAAADKTIRLLDVSRGEVVRTLEGHTHHVMALDWQHDGQRLVSAGADQTVKVWDVESGTASRTIGGFPTELSAIDIVPGTSQIVAASINGLLKLADANQGKVLRNFNAGGEFTFALAVTPDGQRLLAGGQDGTVRIWNLDDGALLHELQRESVAQP